MIGPPVDDAMFDEVLEAAGEEDPRHAEIDGQIVESSQTQVQVTDHQWCPGVADHIERPGHRTVHRGEVGSSHGLED